ncbi:amino acid ABC transporter permease [Solicola gregarius]|uniref:Amino acid ABC transporter permease n=1 Tax=Solicola gregarius TaxID=2908642 RepID=A0AA46TLR8_9ACTN|nr:amino acid ABC transporter permease [Solicola gregarius]UYM07262.1 amino acid ABC transporter permease [Solicola gregarius]
MTDVRDERTTAGSELDAEDIRAVPVRHPGRWIAALGVGILGAMLVNTILTNPRFRWDVVGEFFTEGVILRGLSLTLQLTVVSMAIGIVLGIVFALMRGSANPILAGAGALYIWFFRGTPILVQLVFWFNLSALYPELGLGIPFGPQFVTFDANTLITPMVAGILGLGLNEGAYMAEIVRGGIVSIDRGQYQAAESLGMTRLQTMRKIVLPQAMKVIIPPTGNQTIAMLKNVSLVSVLAIPDLLYSAQIIYARNYQTIPLLIVASIWYLICTSILTIVQSRIERRFTPDAVVDDPLLPRIGRNLMRWGIGRSHRRTPDGEAS